MSNRRYDANYEPRPAEQARQEELRYQRFLAALERAGVGNRSRAEQAAVAVLGAIELRIGGAEAHDVNEELPWALRDLLRQSERDPRSRPPRFGRTELLDQVAGALGLDPVEAERTTRAVLQATRGLLSEQEASDVAAHLPKDMQDLWAPPV